MAYRRLFAALVGGLTACTGFSLGENEPGQDTWTDPPPTQPGEHKVGAIAVERDEDQLWVVHEENRNGTVRGRLAAIDPVTREVTDLLDVSGTEDRRVVFPASDRMILMAQEGGTEHLVLIDTAARDVLAKRTVPTWYWGTRTSPSGRALVVADNADPEAPLHVIDTATLAHQVLPHGGDAIEAMWNRGNDTLTALSVVDPFTDHPRAQLLQWDLGGADLAAPLPAPVVKWELAGYDWDFGFSFTWIGVSPDDRWAVFPVVKRNPGQPPEHVLLVLDQSTGGVRLVAGSGPVGFTHDSSAIVSYGTARDGMGGQDLWLIDPITLARRTVSLPGESLVSFHTMRDSNHIITTPVLPEFPEPLMIYNPSTGAMVPSSEVGIDLHDLVTRPGHGEVFLESGGTVFDLAIATGVMRTVPLAETVQNINVTPAADRAFASAAATATIYPIAMASAAQDGAAIRLASPFAGIFSGDKLLDTAARRAGAPRTPHPRLVSRRAHDGDAISLDRR